MLPLIGSGDAAPHLLSGCPPTNTRPPACEIGRPQHSGCRHSLQDVFVTGAFLAYASAGISRWRDILSARLTCRDHGPVGALCGECRSAAVGQIWPTSTPLRFGQRAPFAEALDEQGGVTTSQGRHRLDAGSKLGLEVTAKMASP